MQVAGDVIQIEYIGGGVQTQIYSSNIWLGQQEDTSTIQSNDT